jgi:hypothetical protein
MLSHYNDRFSTYAGATQAQLNVGTLPRITSDELDSPTTEPRARYWIAGHAVDDVASNTWHREWFLGWRDITGQEKWRTFVTSALPRSAVNDKFLLAFPANPRHGSLLQSVWSSFAYDYLSRQKISGTGMKYFLAKQLACPTPATFDAASPWAEVSLAEFVRPRILELTYTSYRMRPYGGDVTGGEPGEPFRWLPERRAQLMAELDAAMLHVYGLHRADAEHVVDSFPVVRKYDERDFGEFRTKRLVLTEYDAMARAAAANPDRGGDLVLTGELQSPDDYPLPADDPRAGQPPWPYRSPLDPPPGQGPRHAPREGAPHA